MNEAPEPKAVDAQAIERETMEFDVVIVGAGPAGLAAAIRLKQLAAEKGNELSVVVLEKGSEVGAHILSGAVIDPVGLDALIPDWRDKGSPLTTKVSEDKFYYLWKTGGIRVPNLFMPPLMSNHGCYTGSLGALTRWLAEQAEALGVEIYPGFSVVDVIFGKNGEIEGVITGDMGVARDGSHKDNYTPGIAILGKYTLFAEGARGSLSKMLINKLGLDAESGPQKFGIGLKELWEVPAEKHKPGLVQHTMGWPLDDKTGGGSFLYHFGERLVSVGFVVHLDYANPYLNPFKEFQRAKTHPLIAEHLTGGKRIAYGARALTEGGYQAIPQLAFPGGALIGCAAGFMNVPRIKGSHNAMLSGMMAAEAAFAAIQAGAFARRARSLSAKRAGERHGERAEEGAQREAALVAARHASRRHAGRHRYVAQHHLPVLEPHAEAQEAGLRDTGQGGAVDADRLSEAGRQAQFRHSLIGVPVRHQSRGERAGASAARRSVDPDRAEPARICRAGAALLPGAGL